MKKAIKIILWILAIIIAVPVILIATLPLWLGPIARPGINATAPKFTKTAFNIGHLSLNPYTGRLELGDTVIGNPEGYDEPTAVAISNLVFDVAMTTLNDKYIHVEEVVVEDLFLSYVKGGENGVDNLTQIQYNLAGGKEKFEAGKAAAEAKADVEAAKLEAKAKAEAEKEKAKLEKMTDEERKAYEEKKEAKELAREAAEQKFVIDHLVINGVKLKYGLITIPVPKIELRDLGKESDGVNVSEFFDAIWQAILKAALATGDAAKFIGGLLGDGASAVGEGAGKAVDAVGDGAKAVGDGATKAVKAIGGLFVK